MPTQNNKKLYNKMLKEGMLPESFCKNWEKDKSAFTDWLALDDKIGVDYKEVENLDDYDEGNYDGYSF